MRLNQYALLGVGGRRALEALRIEPEVIHLNEGHAAFGALEEPGATLQEIVEDVPSAHTVFTTHTPVPAGNDAYPGSEVGALLEPLIDARGLDEDAVLALGRTHPEDQHEPFGITQLAIRTSRATNAVSRRHGEVAREMWQELWPDRSPVRRADHPRDQRRARSDVAGAPDARAARRAPRPRLDTRAADPQTWAGVDAISDEALLAVRREQRARAGRPRPRTDPARPARAGEERSFVEAGEVAFDPDVLTIGFARRVATYKRLGLMVHDAQRALDCCAATGPCS